jgi:hypothetical protein
MVPSRAIPSPAYGNGEKAVDHTLFRSFRLQQLLIVKSARIDRGAAQFRTLHATTGGCGGALFKQP